MTKEIRTPAPRLRHCRSRVAGRPRPPHSPPRAAASWAWLQRWCDSCLFPQIKRAKSLDRRMSDARGGRPPRRGGGGSRGGGGGRGRGGGNPGGGNIHHNGANQKPQHHQQQGQPTQQPTRKEVEQRQQALKKEQAESAAKAAVNADDAECASLTFPVNFAAPALTKLLILRVRWPLSVSLTLLIPCPGLISYPLATACCSDTHPGHSIADSQSHLRRQTGSTRPNSTSSSPARLSHHRGCHSVP